MNRAFPFILLTGGCRSGKSAYAQRLAESFSRRCLYLATAEARDEEMRQRVRLHQEMRGKQWKTYESAPEQGRHLWRVLPELVAPGESLLFDCLTLWVAGCMKDSAAPEDFSRTCNMLLGALWQLPCPVIIVTNEVGMGVVPPTPSGRAFRDMAGMAGQRAAALADLVVLMVNGIPLAVKGALPSLGKR